MIKVLREQKIEQVNKYFQKVHALFTFLWMSALYLVHCSNVGPLAQHFPHPGPGPVCHHMSRHWDIGEMT